MIFTVKNLLRIDIIQIKYSIISIFICSVFLPDRVYWDIFGNVSLDFLDIHVGNVFESSWETVVFTDEGVEDISEVEVGVFITSIDTAMLVVKLNSACYCLNRNMTKEKIAFDYCLRYLINH